MSSLFPCLLAVRWEVAVRLSRITCVTQEMLALSAVLFTTLFAVTSSQAVQLIPSVLSQQLDDSKIGFLKPLLGIFFFVISLWIIELAPINEILADSPLSASLQSTCPFGRTPLAVCHCHAAASALEKALNYFPILAFL